MDSNSTSRSSTSQNNMQKSGDKSEIEIYKYLLKVAEELIQSACPIDLIKKFEKLKNISIGKIKQTGTLFYEQFIHLYEFLNEKLINIYEQIIGSQNSYQYIQNVLNEIQNESDSQLKELLFFSKKKEDKTYENIYDKWSKQYEISQNQVMNSVNKCFQIKQNQQQLLGENEQKIQILIEQLQENQQLKQKNSELESIIQEQKQQLSNQNNSIFTLQDTLQQQKQVNYGVESQQNKEELIKENQQIKQKLEELRREHQESVQSQQRQYGKILEEINEQLKERKNEFGEEIGKKDQQINELQHLVESQQGFKKNFIEIYIVYLEKYQDKYPDFEVWQQKQNDAQDMEQNKSINKDQIEIQNSINQLKKNYDSGVEEQQLFAFISYIIQKFESDNAYLKEQVHQLQQQKQEIQQTQEEFQKQYEQGQQLIELIQVQLKQDTDDIQEKQQEFQQSAQNLNQIQQTSQNQGF
ncbi:hypothetical protein PPERSA_00897 [Pseudocohnilembus persalinus]|uniref:Uncharacterized protein n=1 Tax=Pseudocohnilembus persalinus TaxID=266149 RepID=A0A0V0QEM1_PSEPJ|nr:hypothetical protein PPERSA_00897 [Pseudocohnilembus persalinus]|eukprot:KRX00670.1 hypothetical protein PPERSA_00897 [Pseudocohnilembus persalinus]